MGLRISANQICVTSCCLQHCLSCFGLFLPELAEAGEPGQTYIVCFLLGGLAGRRRGQTCFLPESIGFGLRQADQLGCLRFSGF